MLEATLLQPRAPSSGRVFEQAAVLLPAPSSAMPRISVVVPTFQRPVLLLRCLTALVEQDFSRTDYEIIVVDDGDDPRTRKVVEGMALRCGSSPRLHYLTADGTQGPAAARNRGWQFAGGTVIAFTDDDAVPAADWLRRGWLAMTPNIAAVCGRVVVPLPTLPTDYERDASGLANAEFVCANCFVRRKALQAIGGFDERFTAAWREDSDLQFSLMEKYGGELRIGREPRALVCHPVRPAGWGVSLSQQRKVQFDALLYKKHPRLYRSHIRSTPRWDYYAIVLSLLIAPAAAAAGNIWLAASAAATWIVLTVALCRLRLYQTSHTRRHVAEMIVTSILLPPLSVFWRCVGAIRYRVLFV